VLKFIVTSRSEISISLVDAQGAIVSVIEEALLCDPRMYFIAVDNPNRNGVLLTIRSADTYNYGSYVSPDREYLVAPDGTISKHAARDRASVASVSNCSLYPNPGTDVITIDFTLREAGDVTIMITDILGKVVYHDNRQFTALGVYKYGVSISTLPIGYYYVRLSAGKSSTIINMVKK
jgi:hypothetical protein